jgi:hypothetical protein
MLRVLRCHLEQVRAQPSRARAARPSPTPPPRAIRRALRALGQYGQEISSDGRAHRVVLAQNPASTSRAACVADRERERIGHAPAPHDSTDPTSALAIEPDGS